MSTVIKASNKDSIAKAIAFNLPDMAGEADAVLDRIRQEATKIIDAARQEAQQIRIQAEREGHQAAEQRVREQMTQEQAQKLSTLLPALQQTVQELQNAKHAWMSHWEKSALRVATAIAERIIRQEIKEHPDIPLTLIREALGMAIGSDEIRIHLNPADCESLGDQVEMITHEVSGLGPVAVCPNPQITQGGCRVETRFGTIDQQFQSQLDRIEEELTGD
ncbi:MAG: FliH/SctL family protein [Planctomycetia bacterium]|jgi:flagellar assembly protein FliH